MRQQDGSCCRWLVRALLQALQHSCHLDRACCGEASCEQLLQAAAQGGTIGRALLPGLRRCCNCILLRSRGTGAGRPALAAGGQPRMLAPQLLQELLRGSISIERWPACAAAVNGMQRCSQEVLLLLRRQLCSHQLRAARRQRQRAGPARHRPGCGAQCVLRRQVLQAQVRRCLVKAACSKARQQSGQCARREPAC